MTKPTRSQSRAAKHDALALFDFNSPTVSAADAAAEWAKGGATRELLSALEAADDRLSNDRDDPRAAALDAVRAVITFGRSSRYGSEGRFSRALELLADELGALPSPPKGEIFPPVRGAVARAQARNIQACAAYAFLKMRAASLPRDEAVAGIATTLDAHGFAYGVGRSANKAEAIVAWAKRSMARAAVEELNRLIEAPCPFDVGQAAALAWLGDELERAGYERAV